MMTKGSVSVGSVKDRWRCSLLGPGDEGSCMASDQLGRSLATRSCSRTLWLAGRAQRTAGKGIILFGNGDYRGLVLAHKSPALKYWDKDVLEVKGLETQASGGGRGRDTEKKEMIEEESISVGEELNVNNGDEW